MNRQTGLDCAEIFNRDRLQQSSRPIIVSGFQPPVPIFQQLAQIVAQRRYFAQERFQFLEFGGGQRMNPSTWRAALIADFENLREIIESEADRERITNKPHAVNRVRRVFAISVRRAARFKQAFSLIVTQRIRANPGNARQLAWTVRVIPQSVHPTFAIIKVGTNSKVKRKKIHYRGLDQDARMQDQHWP
ncbi:MAG TPA: hypothetical protein VIM99_07505 [Blastocatellia bacterium]